MKLEYRIPASGSRVSLTVTEDAWILDGKRLGPDTCTTLDFVAFCARTVYDGSFYMLDILECARRGSQFVPSYCKLERLIKWLRRNFDYPEAGVA